MPLKNGRMTTKERSVAQAFVDSGDVKEAARRARVDLSTARRALQNPTIIAETIRIQTARLANESLPLAVDTLNSIMRNEKAPAGARVSAAKVVIDRVLGTHADGTPKEPHEMTADELSRAIGELQRMASDKAKAVVIDHESQPKPGVFD